MPENDDKLIKVSEYLHQVLREMNDHPVGIPTGIPELDSKMRGLKDGELYIIGGRPSMGKSALMTDMILSASIEKNILVFSLEMSARLLIERMLANLARVNYSNLKYGDLLTIETQRVESASSQLFSRNIFICDDVYLTSSKINRVMQLLKEQNIKVDCVFLDYLQLMGLQTATDNRNQDLARISGSLKGVAREYNVPVIVLSQLNRRVESRDSRRPQMSDLRDSGAVEQDADAILFLYRPGYYTSVNSVNAVDNGDTEIIISKQRNGPTGIVNCIWDATSMSFTDGQSNEVENIGDI
jgi:replicative DNA helicase